MKLFFRYVVEVLVFNENGQLVTKLDTLKENSLMYSSTNKNLNYLAIKDCALDTTLLEGMGTPETTPEESDYDKLIKNSDNNFKTITFGAKEDVPCKLVCLGVMRKLNCNDTRFKIEIPKASLVNQFELRSDNEELSGFDYIFKLDQFNEKGDLFKLHIEDK